MHSYIMIVPEQYFKLIFTSVIVDKIKNTIHSQSFDSEQEAIKYCLDYMDKKIPCDYQWQVIFGFPTSSGSRSNRSLIS